ncbi:alpha/beta fold hydrolase [Evansella sp. AB-P1]|uniref:alpha/beta hydrolase n=1 Tax=Evansella sp. AB-P1 TaxID=3037653 RepID=UPI00241EB8B6|nr:alpha/beta fold hydrolase [Evansella sp. AB-P1]MDG5789358.1 alpha/beta fold hydrolase [Evansella sp. AB-P1]
MSYGNRCISLVVLIFSFLVLGACAGSNESNENEDGVEVVTESIIGLLVEGDYGEVRESYFSEELEDSLSIEEIQVVWEQKTRGIGDFVKVRSIDFFQQGSSYHVAEATLEYDRVVFPMRFTFNDGDRLAGFHLGMGYANRSFPSNVSEEDVIIGEGSEFELGGTLTLPEGATGEVPAVVLVHGSGPSDRDEALYAYRPFRDIAWGLAEQGIAVLRYDKRTYTYRSEMALMEGLTVMEETVEDAVLAAELLRGDDRIDSEKIYVAGHSLGGMLAPRIDAAGGDFAGLIILGGSPRPLWEIIYDQNIAFIEMEDFDEVAKAEYERQVEEEMNKAQRLTEMTEDEALQETIFGQSVYYFLDMDGFDMEEYLTEYSRPIFVLHGEDDFQVYTDPDFAKWEELLADHDQATLKSYPGLNHFFISYEGPDKGTLKEYEHPALVDEDVINDIASWIR